VEVPPLELRAVLEALDHRELIVREVCVDLRGFGTRQIQKEAKFDSSLANEAATGSP